MWRGGPELPRVDQGINVLNIPIGCNEFVLTQLLAKHERLFPDSSHAGCASAQSKLATLKIAHVVARGLEDEIPIESLQVSANTPMRPSVSKDPHRNSRWRTRPLRQSFSSNVLLPELGDGKNAQMLSQSGLCPPFPSLFPGGRLRCGRPLDVFGHHRSGCAMGCWNRA